MSQERTIVVGVEDLATAGIVAVEAAHVAMHQNADAVVLVHVLDEHPLLTAVYGSVGYAAAVKESPEDGERILALAEAALRAEFEALKRSTPAIRHEISQGKPSAVIKGIAGEVGAVAVVLGARRPHAFGRLTHPNVREEIADRAACPIHIASLQAAPDAPPAG